MNNRDVTTIEELKKKHEKRIQWGNLADTLFTEIAKIGESMKEQKLTRRLETKIKERYPNYTIYMEYKKIFNWFELRLWGDGIGYDDGYYMVFRDWKEFFENCERMTHKNEIGSQSEYQAKFELDHIQEIEKDLATLKETVKAFKNKYTNRKTNPDYGQDITYGLKDLLQGIL